MGHREVKRVPLDFKWPLKRVWRGYMNPYKGPIICRECEGTGLNPASKQINDDFYDNGGFGIRWRYLYGIDPEGKPASRPPWKIVGDCRAWNYELVQEEVDYLVLKGNRLTEFTHKWIHENGWQKKCWNTNGFWCPKCKAAVPQLGLEHITHYCTCTGKGEELETPCLLLSGDDIRLHIPRAEEVNEWEKRGRLEGHDEINRHYLVQARCLRLGVYGHCARCHGKGEIKPPRKQKKQWKKWKEYEPPAGEGWQLWDTCSDGSPISPVFNSAEGLADWCEKNATLFGDEGTTRENWLKMFLEDFIDAGSLMIAEGDYFGALVNYPEYQHSI